MYYLFCYGKWLLNFGDCFYELLCYVKGMILVDFLMVEQCCGFGGIFCIKNFDMSVVMVNDKVCYVCEIEVEYVVVGDNFCFMNIGGVLLCQNLGVKLIYIVEIFVNIEED